MRVAVFGSFYRGYHVLGELLYGPCKDIVEVVGVATDDPAQPYVNAKNRVWQYPHSQSEEIMVADLACEHGIPVYHERIKSEKFYDIIENSWKPDLCLMATFGQLVNSRLIKLPQRGFYNFHPSDIGKWPSRYAGCNPFEAMFRNGEKICAITLHEVNEEFDQGARVACSEAIMIPPAVTVTDMHKISSPVAACLLRKMLPRLLGLAS